MRVLLLSVFLSFFLAPVLAQQPNTIQNWGGDFFWDAPISSPVPVTGYNLYESQTPGGPWTKVNTALITGTTFNYPTAQQGSFYAITSVGDNGLETLSDELHLVPAGKPLFLRLFQVIVDFFRAIWGWWV